VRRRRPREPNAVGVEEVEWGIRLSSRLGRLGERRELPPAGSSAPLSSPPRRETNMVHSKRHRTLLLDIVNHEKSILQAEMHYVMKTSQQTRA